VRNKVIVRKLSEINELLTTHGIGYKKILLSNTESNTNLMQAAVGRLITGENIENHVHVTMEEYYFFLSGSVLFSIDKIEYLCNSGYFIKVPCNTFHNIVVKEDCQFIYWGIAI